MTDADNAAGELEALRASIAAVLDKEVDRRAVHAHIDGGRRLDRDLWRTAAELGWLAIGLPEEHGGIGYGAAGLAMLHGELGRVVAPGSFVASLSAARTLAETADAAICAAWLPRLIGGEASLAVPADLERSSPISAEHALFGSAARLLGAEDAAAALVPVGDGAWGLVPLADAGVTPIDMWDRTRTVLRADLTGIAPAATIWEGARTEASLRRGLGIALAADSVGGARSILNQTVAYMKQREQFGRPIASFQALKHRVADLASLVLGAGEILAQAIEAETADADADMWAAIAKALATERYTAVAGECLQLHGGIAVTWEYDVHLFLKRARLSEALLGPNATTLDRAATLLEIAARAGRSAMALEPA